MGARVRCAYHNDSASGAFFSCRSVQFITRSPTVRSTIQNELLQTHRYNGARTWYTYPRISCTIYLLTLKITFCSATAPQTHYPVYHVCSTILYARQCLFIGSPSVHWACSSSLQAPKDAGDIQHIRYVSFSRARLALAFHLCANDSGLGISRDIQAQHILTTERYACSMFMHIHALRWATATAYVKN